MPTPKPDEKKDEIKRRFNPSEQILDSNVVEMRLTCVMTTEMKASDGYALLARGWRLRSGGDSIPLLWYHGMDLRGGLPLGSVRNFRAEHIKTEGFEGEALIGDKFYYSPGDAVKHLQSDLVTMPAIVFDMRRQGHFKAVSVGFDVDEMLDDDDVAEDGVNVRAWTLHELSDLPVGMDPWALDRMLKSRSLTEQQRDWLLGRECHECGECSKTTENPHQPATRQADVKAENITILDRVAQLKGL